MIIKLLSSNRAPMRIQRFDALEIYYLAGGGGETD